MALTAADGTVLWACSKVRRWFGPESAGRHRCVSRPALRAGNQRVSDAFAEVVMGPTGTRRCVKAEVMLGEHRRAVEIEMINVLDVEGVHAVLVRGRDISLQERAAAAANDAYLRELLTDVCEFVLHLDDDGLIRYASPSFEHYIDPSPVGRTVVDALPGADVDALAALTAEVVTRCQRRVIARVCVEMRHGGEAPVELTARNVSTSAVDGIVVVGRILGRAPDAHLSVVAGGTDRVRHTAVDVLEAYGRLTPGEKLAVIDGLRSRPRH